MTDSDRDLGTYLPTLANERVARLSWAVLAEQTIEIAAAGDVRAIFVIRAALVVLTVGVMALLGSRGSMRYAHARLLLLWSIPITATLLQQVTDGVETAILVFFVELVCVVFLVDSRSAIAGVAIALLAELGLFIVDMPPFAAVYASVLCTAGIVGISLQIIVRRSLIRAERSRLEAVEAQVELEHRMEELVVRETEQEQLRDRVFHAQRLQAIGTLAAGLAHDMNNVLAAISMAAQTSMLDATDQEVAPLQRIIDAAGRGGNLTHDLLGYSQRGKYRKESVTGGSIVDEAVAIARTSRDAAVAYEVETVDQGLSFVGDRVRIGQAIVNLCVNAADAMEGRGTIRIVVDSIELDLDQARTQDVQAGRFVRISVRDTGGGIDSETLPHVFEPFFTTKPADRGTGLGLAMVWGVLRAHGGTVNVRSQIGDGTTFELLLPLAIEHATPGSVPTSSEAKVILIVDDEHAVRVMMKRMLARFGYETLTAENGAVALELFDLHRARIGLVILDMGMPVMGGAECFRRLRSRSNVPIVIASGYAGDDEIQDLVQGGALLLEKPYKVAALRAHLERVLGASVPMVAREAR